MLFNYDTKIPTVSFVSLTCFILIPINWAEWVMILKYGRYLRGMRQASSTRNYKKLHFWSFFPVYMQVSNAKNHETGVISKFQEVHHAMHQREYDEVLNTQNGIWQYYCDMLKINTLSNLHDSNKDRRLSCIQTRIYKWNNSFASTPPLMELRRKYSKLDLRSSRDSF